MAPRFGDLLRLRLFASGEGLLLGGADRRGDHEATMSTPRPALCVVLLLVAAATGRHKG